MQRDKRQEILYWRGKGRATNRLFSKLNTNTNKRLKIRKLYFPPSPQDEFQSLILAGFVTLAQLGWYTREEGNTSQIPEWINNEQRHPFSDLTAAFREGMWEQHVKTQSFLNSFFLLFFFSSFNLSQELIRCLAMITIHWHLPLGAYSKYQPSALSSRGG